MFVLKNGYLTTNINVVAFNVNKQTMGVRTDRAVAIEIIIEETDRLTSTGQKYRKSYNMTAVVRGVQ